MHTYAPIYLLIGIGYICKSEFENIALESQVFIYFENFISWKVFEKNSETSPPLYKRKMQIKSWELTSNKDLMQFKYQKPKDRPDSRSQGYIVSEY